MHVLHLVRTHMKRRINHLLICYALQAISHLVHPALHEVRMCRTNGSAAFTGIRCIQLSAAIFGQNLLQQSLDHTAGFGKVHLAGIALLEHIHAFAHVAQA